MLICFCESPERKEADRKEVSKQQEEKMVASVNNRI